MKFYLLFSVISLTVMSDCLNTEIAFIKIGTYRGVDNEQNLVTKSFHVPRYFQATWVNAVTICNAYNMELARFDSAEEFESVRQLMINNADHFTHWTHIDGMTTLGGSKTEWFWSQTGEKIGFPMVWNAGNPDHSQNRQWCLALGTKSANIFRFDDIDCFHHHEEKFLCQNVEEVTIII